MAFRIDKQDNSLVLDGVEKGIADSPHQGISDMRNVNIISVLGEGSVNFSTVTSTPPTVTTGTITAVNTGTETITFTGGTNLETGMAVVFAGSLPTGLVAGTVYWITKVTGTTMTVQSDLNLSTTINLTSSTTGGTFTTYTMGQPQAFTTNTATSDTWMIDASGQVWTNATVTFPSNYWIFTGNVAGTGGWGVANGIVYYEASDGSRYIFVFRSSAIDYIRAELNGASRVTNTSWQYGWNPANGTLTNSNYLKTINNSNNSHEAMVAPDSRVYYCDSNWIGRWYQTDPSVAFVPTTPSTYTFDQTALLPTTDKANCLTFLGTNILIGGIRNVIYPWDRFNTNFSYPILLSEYLVTKMVTINTNTYIFVGNRGRIYVTNGSNVNLYKKVPDHISGTVEPYFTWKGATNAKNQLYFSFSVTDNSGNAITQYGGVWAIDLDTNAIRLVNKLSYGTYAGYASAIIPNFNFNPAGTGLFSGWNDGVGGVGIDSSSSNPYTGSQATIDFDLIPIGTFNKPQNFGQVEYKLTRPLVSGESIVLKTRLIFNTTNTGYTSTLTDSTVGDYSTSASSNIANAQWVQFQAVLNSTVSSPSYVRLKEIRIKLI